MNVLAPVLFFAIIHNVIFIQYLGIVPLTYFLASWHRVNLVSLTMTAVLLAVSLVYTAVLRIVLQPFGLWYLEHITLVVLLVVVTLLVRRIAVEMFPFAVRRMRRVVPLITLNATVYVMTAMIAADAERWRDVPLAAIGVGLGFWAAAICLAAIRRRLLRRRIPRMLSGAPVWYLSAAITALGFLVLNRLIGAGLI